MTIDCGSCGARYNIQDSLIPPQGARVKCKKCATMIAIPPPPVAELEPQDIELIPPAPEPPPPPPALSVPVAETGASVGSEFETTPEPFREPVPPMSQDEMPLERYPGESRTEPPMPMPAPDDEFERAGALPRFGSPPAFTEASTPAAASYGSTMTIEPIAASSTAAPVTETEAETETTAQRTTPSQEATVEEVPASVVSAPAPLAAAPAQAESTTLPTGTPLPSGLSAEDRSKHEKARRLARVLASDISIYNREKKERGIREGNLVAMLGYEIKKSWEIYKERVGSEFANSTPYFRDALNEMLADGKKIF